MTTYWMRRQHEFLAVVSSCIVNSVPKVNRVVYDLASAPPGTTEWE